MSTPNPLAPQGSLLEQQAKGRSTFHVISFIGAVHVMLLCGILWTACSRDDKPKVETPNTLGGTDPYAVPPADTNATGLPPAALPIASTNPATAVPLTSVPPTPAPATPGLPPATPTPAVTLPPSAVVTPPAPAPLPEATSAATGTASEYKVAKGDIGESIAKKHGVSLKALTAANPGVNWSRLKQGQTLQIPAAAAAAPTAAPSTGAPADATGAGGTTYVVKPGDTGNKIATRHGVKWSEIRKASRLTSDALHPGQKLTIPAKSGAAAAPAATPTAAPAAPAPTAIPVAPTGGRGPGQ